MRHRGFPAMDFRFKTHLPMQKRFFFTIQKVGYHLNIMWFIHGYPLLNRRQFKGMNVSLAFSSRLRVDSVDKIMDTLPPSESAPTGSMCLFLGGGDLLHNHIETFPCYTLRSFKAEPEPSPNSLSKSQNPSERE